MGNYELLPSVNASCKNSLPRETHLHSAAGLSWQMRAGPSGSRREQGSAENTVYTWPPAPRYSQGWVGGFLFDFISLESFANLPSLCPSLWGPRELLSFDKGKRKSAPGQAAFARIPPQQEGGAGGWGPDSAATEPGSPDLQEAAFGMGGGGVLRKRRPRGST